MDYTIKDIKLADRGKKRVEWAFQHMQVLKILREHYGRNKIFKGLRIGCCLHVTTETANLVINMRDAGAQVFLCASNPLSTQDDVAAYLVRNEKISVFAKHGDDKESYYKNIKKVMSKEPHLVVDDGGDLISSFHRNISLAKNIIGATEETTTGVIRLRSLAKNKLLKFPVIAVNDANTKHFFDNRYGTGQSSIDGLLRATNILLAGKTAVVSGYGWCGRGIARRFQGMGARVIVTEVDPLRALEAVMDGYWVMPMSEASKIGDVFITSTGNISVITLTNIRQMKDGAILGNAGHFNVEIDLSALEKAARKKRNVREGLDEYTFANGKRIYILGEGRLVNLACAEGHPSSVMDMSFANQFLSLKYLKEHPELKPDVYQVPEEVDKKVADMKLKGMNIKIDKPTRKQAEYVNSWELGT